MVTISKDVYFACDECPICVGWEHRLQAAREGSYTPQFEYCSCDKMGDYEFYQVGYCSDAWIFAPPAKKKGIRRAGRGYRRHQNERHASRRLDIARNCEHAYGVWAAEKNGTEVVGRRRSSNREGYLKRVSNRRVRHSALEPSCRKGAYKRVFDYEWIID